MSLQHRLGPGTTPVPDSSDSCSVKMSSTGGRQQHSRTVLPVQLDVVRGPERLPADEPSREMLRGKLHLLQADSTELEALLTELSTHLVSIKSEERTFFVTFRTFEEIWKFTTYHQLGLLSRCLEDLLFDPAVWLSSLEDRVAVDASIQEETLSLIYSGILMQEGSLFASCPSQQVFDCSTSGGDLYLEPGDIAQFEPPFLGSGWTVLCLASGARGTAPRPPVEPVHPFHQWFLKSDADSFLVGGGKPACHFPVHFARGTCVVSQKYDSEGSDELSVAPDDRVDIVGVLLSCLDWFTGRKESTGEVGLVKTSLVRPSSDTYSSTDVFRDGEESSFFSLHEKTVIEETVAVLQKTSTSNIGHNYKLDLISRADVESVSRAASPGDPDTRQSNLQDDLLRFLDDSRDSDMTATAAVEREECPPAEEEHHPGPPRLEVPAAPPLLGENHHGAESFAPLFSFLEGRDGRAALDPVYRMSSELLASSVFHGQSDEDQLVAFLGAAREAARKRRLFWAQTRLCFLLGRLCLGRSKFSQARVYLEECLAVPPESFADFRLLASIYSNLVAVYLTQKNAESFFAAAERLAALLTGRPECLEDLADSSALRYVLRKSVLCRNPAAEAWALRALVEHHWTRGEAARVVPYLEGLLLTRADGPLGGGVAPSHGYQTLGRFYGDLALPRLSLSATSRASQEGPPCLSHCLSITNSALDQVSRLRGLTGPQVHPRVAPFLHQALSLVRAEEPGQDYVLQHLLTLSLCRLFCEHRMTDRAIHYMRSLLGSPPGRRQCPRVTAAQSRAALVWLAWLHIENQQPGVALQVLDSVLASLPEHCTVPQEGVVLNMRGVALRRTGDFQGAAESYWAAVHVCQEYEDVPNWAVAQANQGLLFLRVGAKRLAQRSLLEAVKLFAELDEGGHEENFVQVLLELGKHYVTQGQLGYGAGCYQWALLLSIAANLLECQLTATQHLCHLYGCESPDQARCIVYSQHQVQLLRRCGDRRQEGDVLETVSRLYLAMATERAYRVALDLTKSSLGIFIDLGCREKEALGWLQAGSIYLLLHQSELVDLYVQAAQNVALSTRESGFLLEVLEAAGDIFFNSRQDRHKAIPFYRDRAMPLAEQSHSPRARLRLCNKLSELMLDLKMFAEAVEFAHVALDISITLGEQLNERVACHRLASLYHSLDQFELAEHHYLKALSLCPSPLQFEEETLYYVRVYQTLGDIIFYDLKDPFDAAGYYNLALAAAVDLGNKRSQLELCTRLATIYHNFLMDRELSLFFYKKARAFAAELNVKRFTVSRDPSRTGATFSKAT